MRPAPQPLRHGRFFEAIRHDRAMSRLLIAAVAALGLCLTTAFVPALAPRSLPGSASGTASEGMSTGALCGLLGSTAVVGAGAAVARRSIVARRQAFGHGSPSLCSLFDAFPARFHLSTGL